VASAAPLLQFYKLSAADIKAFMTDTLAIRFDGTPSPYIIK